jgi:hypothetical protein
MSMDGQSTLRVPGATATVGSLEAIRRVQAALDSRDIIGQAKGIIRLLTNTESQAAFGVAVPVVPGHPPQGQRRRNVDRRLRGHG